jgi:hypothetical protein
MLTFFGTKLRFPRVFFSPLETGVRNGGSPCPPRETIYTSSRSSSCETREVPGPTSTPPRLAYHGKLGAVASLLLLILRLAGHLQLGGGVQ